MVASMNKNQRIVYGVSVTLLAVSLMSSLTSVANAGTVRNLSANSEITSSASSSTAVQKSILVLGIALVGGAVIFRRKLP